MKKLKNMFNQSGQGEGAEGRERGSEVLLRIIALHCKASALAHPTSYGQTWIEYSVSYRDPEGGWRVS